MLHVPSRVTFCVVPDETVPDTFAGVKGYFQIFFAFEYFVRVFRSRDSPLCFQGPQSREREACSNLYAIPYQEAGHCKFTHMHRAGGEIAQANLGSTRVHHPEPISVRVTAA
jgi:hypothetical protein